MNSGLGVPARAFVRPASKEIGVSVGLKLVSGCLTHDAWWFWVVPGESVGGYGFCLFFGSFF